MGNAGSCVYDTVCYYLGLLPELRVLILGIDGAGKTTLWWNSRTDRSVPTVGFSVETTMFRNISTTAWDVSSDTAIRPLWRHYFEFTNALVWVVDCSDQSTYAEVKKAFEMVLEDLPGVPVVVLANKVDLPHASPGTLAHDLGLPSLLHDRQWTLMPACGLRGEGLHAGLDWINQQCRR